MSTLQSPNRFRLAFYLNQNNSAPGPVATEPAGRESQSESLPPGPFPIAVACPVESSIERSARAATPGTEPGRAGTKPRPQTQARAAKHSQLIRRYLNEPEGEFDRCLSIALDRMIDAAQAQNKPDLLR